MDPDSYQQEILAAHNFGEQGRYLQEGMMVEVSYFNGEAITGISAIQSSGHGNCLWQARWMMLEAAWAFLGGQPYLFFSLVHELCLRGGRDPQSQVSSLSGVKIDLF